MYKVLMTGKTYRTISELNDCEMRELKREYLNNHLMEVEDRWATSEEECNIDRYVSDSDMFEHYKDMLFTDEDFWCNIN